MMRKVNKDFHDPPPDLQKGFEEKKNNLMERKEYHQFDGRIYNNAVKEELKKLYHSKCAYCESRLSDDTFTIEHYRPKKGDYSYYWLGYEWSNLLPVCEDCNKAKKDRFPVEVSSLDVRNSDKKCRVKKPKLSNGDWDIDAMKANHPYLLDEKPYLLHPEIDEPRDFLCVNCNGEITYEIAEEVDQYCYKRAQHTIDTANLKRDSLIIQRRKIIANYQNLFRKQTLAFMQLWNKYKAENMLEEHKDKFIKMAFRGIFEDFEEQLNEDKEYTLTYWCLWRDIKTMLFTEISKGDQDIEELLDYALSSYIQSKDKE